jgi:hypothetical protein
MDLTAFIGTLDGSADAALKRMMPYICSMCANLLYLADYVAEAAVKITGETLFKPDVNRNIESILGYTSFNSTMADALSVYQDNLRAYPLFTALKGMTRVLNVTDANPMTEDRVARRFGNESSLRRRLTNVFLSSWNIKKGTNVYNQYARLVIGWIEATISKVTLIYLRVLNVGAHAGSATMMGGAFKSFIELFQQHPTLSLPGRAIPASAMLAITIGTLLGNAGSRYSSTSGAGIARTVALALYGMGSMVRLGGLAVESLAIRSFQAWIQGGAFFRAVAESPAAEAIIAKTLMVNKGPVAFGRVFIKDMLRAAGSRGASFLQERQLYNAISRYNSALSLISSDVYKRVMGGFFASADIVVSVQNVLDSVAKFQNGKPVGGALYAATAGFNFASGACGLLALMAAAHPVMAATLTASVLVCSIISLTTNIAALLVDS